MDNNTSVPTLILLVMVFVFSFVFSFQALAESHLFYIFLALAGYGLWLMSGLIFRLALHKEGGRIAVWFITKLGVKYGFL